MKKCVLLLLACCWMSCTSSTTTAADEIEVHMAERLQLLEERIPEAELYVRQKGFNTEWALIADLGAHSGLPRLHLWDFSQQKPLKSWMVSHGCGPHPWGGTASKSNPSFSNENDSHLSSLGKYRIGERGVSQWGVGIKYLLYGLESTNNRAMQRAIVLHSWEAVPDAANYPEGTPEGWGCPAISNAAMLELDPLLRSSSRPVLLWIYR